MSDYVDGRDSDGTGKSAGSPVHTLYIGSPDGNSFGSADRTAVVEKLSSCFAGFTINDAEGFFEGRPVATLIGSRLLLVLGIVKMIVGFVSHPSTPVKGQ